MAERLGVDPSTYCRRERGTTIPGLSGRAAIMQELGYGPRTGPEHHAVGLGPRVLAWRRSQGVSQADLARRLGMDPKTLRQAEKSRPVSGRIREALRRLLVTREGTG